MSDAESQSKTPHYPEGAHHFRGAPALAMLFAILFRICLPLIATFALAIWIDGPWEILALAPSLAALIAEELWPDSYTLWTAFLGGGLARTFARERGGRND